VFNRLQGYGVRIGRRAITAVGGNVFGIITRVTTDSSVVALTFDDGPDPEYTPRLLDILEKYQARATFFMVGEAAHAHPELVRRVGQAGHAIGNHSWDHPSFPLISGRERRAQIRACAKAIAPYGQRLFRPPYSSQNLASRLDAFLLGYKVVMFDAWSDDWCGGDYETIARQLERRVHPGSIIVLHDRLADALDQTYFNREPTLKALEIFLSRTGDRFCFVTVPELLRHGRSQRELWHKKSTAEFLNKLLVQEGPHRVYLQVARGNWLGTLLKSFLKLRPKFDKL
jgi:peptidoglycan/xylan/chitin deacetylase (PgdA/CDA1 family)